MARKAKGKSVSKFKAIDKESNDFKDWEGEELHAQSDTKLNEDRGTGKAVVLRCFDFAANPETFKDHKPTAQELFNVHKKGMESLMWTDGMAPFEEVEPRLLFSKNGKYYRFIVACLPREALMDKPKTLTELLSQTS
jgi:hypothetical protein